MTRLKFIHQSDTVSQNINAFLKTLLMTVKFFRI